MKIGFVTYGLDRPLTGIGRYTLEMASVFDRMGVDVTLLVSGGLGDLASTALSHHHLKFARLAPALMTLGSLQIRMQAKRYKFDIVHDPIGVTPFFFGLGGAKGIVTVHDVFAFSIPHHSSRFDDLVYRYWLPHVLPKVSKIITVSEHSKHDIMKYIKIVEDKIIVVYNGIDSVFQPLSDDEVYTYLQKQFAIAFPYILFIGNLTKRKNLETLLRAFAVVKDEFQSHQLVLVGPSTFRSTELAPLITELKIADRLISLGQVPNEALPWLYNGADVFAFPSLYEGFGLPPLEAMACGTPVVVSNSSSLPEVVGDAGLLFEATQVDQLAAAIRRVLSDDMLRENLSSKGLARAKGFTWQATASRVLDIYQSVL